MKIVVVVKTRGHFNDETIKGNKRIPNLFISSVGTRQSLIEFESGVKLFGASHIENYQKSYFENLQEISSIIYVILVIRGGWFINIILVYNMYVLVLCNYYFFILTQNEGLGTANFVKMISTLLLDDVDYDHRWPKFSGNRQHDDIACVIALL